jgi:aminoglycoside phosphotransferase (APT) family kinase protein
MLSRPDADLARRDPAVAALPLLLDAEAFADLVRSLGPASPIERARLIYLRYKPGTNCLALYRLVTGAGEVEAYAKAYAPGCADKLRKARGRGAAAGPLGLGRVVLEDHAVVVHFFPNDARMKSLACLWGEGERREMLDALIPGRAEFRRARVRGLRYKPERRHVARVEGEGGARAALKIYTGPGYRAASVNAEAFVSRGALRLPKLLGASERRRALAVEWLDGDLLADAYTRPGFDPAAVRVVGAALAELHSQSPSGLAALTPAREAEALRATAEGLAFLCPALAGRALAVARRLARALASAPLEARTVHGDFYAKQVLLRGAEGAALLDLDEAARGDPAADLGNFVAHLERERLRGRLDAETAGRVSVALLEGYEKNVGRARPKAGVTTSRVRLHAACGLFRLAPFPFRDREDGWPEAVEEILRRVEELSEADAARAARHGTAHAVTSSNEHSSTVADSTSHVDSRGRENSHGRGDSRGLEDEAVRVSDPFGAAADPLMPLLARARDVSEAGRVLGERLPSHLRGATLRAIRVTRHKPRRRAVVEFDFEMKGADGVERFTLLGKARARGLDEAGFRLQQSLRRAGFGDESADGVSVPEPVALAPEFGMWLQRRAPGGTAAAPLASEGGVVLARRVAEAIHKLHRAEVPVARRHAMRDEVDILRRRLAAVAAEKPLWSSRLERIFAACERLAASVPEAEHKVIHRDFYAEQVIVSGPRLHLIDFDLCCAGDPALDAGNFIAHITEQSLRSTGDPAAWRDREEALEERFVELSGAHARRAVRAYATLTLARHVSISTQFEDRKVWTAALIELCEERLGLARHVFPRRGPPEVFASGAKEESYA